MQLLISTSAIILINNNPMVYNQLKGPHLFSTHTLLLIFLDSFIRLKRSRSFLPGHLKFLNSEEKFHLVSFVISFLYIWFFPSSFFNSLLNEGDFPAGLLHLLPLCVHDMSSVLLALFSAPLRMCRRL